MAFDIENMTLGEIETFERYAKMSITMLPREDAIKGLPLRALALVVGRRSDPAMKWDATESLTFAQARTLIGLEDGTDAEGNGTPSNGSKP